jgi:hypothetical protein
MSADDVRLLWAPEHSRQRLIGVWWPRSRNITVELAGLLPAADEHLGMPVLRVTLNATAWDHQPRRLYLGARMIRLAWFNSFDPDLVGLGTTPLEGNTVVVVPADCSESDGERIFAELRAEKVWPTEPADIIHAAEPARI